MNTLALIRAQILKAQRLHQAQLATVSNPRAQISEPQRHVHPQAPQGAPFSWLTALPQQVLD